MNKRSSLNNYFRAFAYACCLAFVLLSACKKNDDQSGSKPDPYVPSNNPYVPPVKVYLNFEFHDTSGRYTYNTLRFLSTWYVAPHDPRSAWLFDPVVARGMEFDGKVMQFPVDKDQIDVNTDYNLWMYSGGLIGKVVAHGHFYDGFSSILINDTTYRIVVKF